LGADVNRRMMGDRDRSGAATLVWHRLDLRLDDNPALAAAVQHGGAIIPVFIWAPEEEGAWPPGGASRWWLHHSLISLEAALRARGSRLVVRRAASLSVLRDLVAETGARRVCWNRRYEPAIVAQDQRIEEALRGDGLEVESFNAALLHEPWTIANQSGRAFQVFTPFWRACLRGATPSAPIPAPERIPGPKRWPDTQGVEALDLLPRPDWAGGLQSTWKPGAPVAVETLERFLQQAFADYGVQRDHPASDGTSRLSPHLHFGEIGPRQIWHAVRQHAARAGLPESAWRTSPFVTELGWREFAYHVLHHFPHTPEAPMRPEFARFPWRQDPAWLHAWQQGRTGFPFVDAGLRELWTTGWMHNRVRMVAASLLVKDLLISWQEGARWFWDTLVDADLASNTLGWQWAAGCGADAAPYFRIFNPTTQGEKFDAEGDYVRRWVPELRTMPARWIHRPAEAPADLLHQHGLEAGRAYPRAVVSHAIAREVALEALARLKSAG